MSSYCFTSVYLAKVGVVGLSVSCLTMLHENRRRIPLSYNCLFVAARVWLFLHSKYNGLHASAPLICIQKLDGGVQ